MLNWKRSLREGRRSKRARCVGHPDLVGGLGPGPERIVPLLRRIMACLNSRRQRRRKKAARRAKWGFELELEQSHSSSACDNGSSSGFAGGLVASSFEDGWESLDMPPISRFVLEGSKLETKVISAFLCQLCEKRDTVAS